MYSVQLDIKQLYYFVQIVEANYNLTEAANRIHITQSALSQFINTYEKDEQVILFERSSNRRLEKLTPYGKIFYTYAKEIISKYEEMNTVLQRKSKNQTEVIRFGSVSSYLRLIFPDFFPKFAMTHPHIQLEIVDDAIPNIYEQFARGELDFATLVEPTHFSEGHSQERFLLTDELKAFVSKNHPLAHKDSLTWEETSHYPIITLPKQFYTFRKITKAYKKRDLHPTIIQSSPQWEYLMESAHQTEAITILPAAVPAFVTNKEIVIKRFEDPVDFNIVLARLNNTKSPFTAQIVADALADYIEERQSLLVLSDLEETDKKQF